MPANRLIIIIACAMAAAAFTIFGLTALGISPIYILIGALAVSVVARYWARRG